NWHPSPPLRSRPPFDDLLAHGDQVDSPSDRIGLVWQPCQLSCRTGGLRHTLFGLLSVDGTCAPVGLPYTSSSIFGPTPPPEGAISWWDSPSSFIKKAYVPARMMSVAAVLSPES